MGGQASFSLDDLLTTASGDGVVQRALEAARRHLGMQIAYVSRFEGEEAVFREVDAPGLESLVKVGDRQPLSDIYCRHILQGRLPELIPDTSKNALAKTLPITEAAPIGSHVSVPIRLPDGSAYGMFCCLSTTPDPSLTERDLDFLRAFAELAADRIIADAMADRDQFAKRRHVEAVLHAQEFTQVYQPIWDFDRARPTGFECLSRFADSALRGPDTWFRDAGDVGLGADLEVAVIEAAMGQLHSLPEEVYLSVNVAPETIFSDRFHRAFDRGDLGRFVIELTEHAQVRDYPALKAALRPLRKRGLRLAVDDAGAGYSSLQHVVRLEPDIVKLDQSLTRGVDVDPVLRALASALIHFAHEAGCELIAEGVETRDELETLVRLGVSRGQGYLLGRPAPIGRALELAGRGPESREGVLRAAG